VAAIYNNFGNLELATGNPKWAKENYEKAIQIWNAAGDDAADQLALTHLCLGRVHTLQQNIGEALKSTSLAETLFLHTTGADKGFMAKYDSLRCPKLSMLI
jgi:tetratricopeptide (TPR) repeat protein